MTSELESDALPTGKIDEQINSEQQKEPIDDIPLKTPEVSDPPPVIHEPTKPIDGEEQMALDPPKRSARKKREPTSAVDQNLDHEIVDTQPLFEQPIIVEGKRSRKPTSRLELSESSTSKTEAPIPEVGGLFTRSLLALVSSTSEREKKPYWEDVRMQEKVDYVH